MKKDTKSIGYPTSLRLQPNLYKRALDIAARDRSNSRIVIERCMELALPILEGDNLISITALLKRIEQDPPLVHDILKCLPKKP